MSNGDELTRGTVTRRKLTRMSSSASSAPSLLLVEDNPPHLRLVQQCCPRPGPGGVSTVSVNRLRAAVHHLRSTEVDCVLLDLVLLDSDGIESVRSIIKMAPNQDGAKRAHCGAECVRGRRHRNPSGGEGAEDYLVKGSIGPDTLHRPIRFAIARCRGRRPTDLHPAPQGALLLHQAARSPTSTGSSQGP